jgi:hypothetical protein
MSATVEMLSRDGGPLAAVSRAERDAAADEARFQLAALQLLDLSREAPADREKAMEWHRALREIASRAELPSFAAIARTPGCHVSTEKGTT